MSTAWTPEDGREAASKKPRTDNNTNDATHFNERFIHSTDADKVVLTGLDRGTSLLIDPPIGPEGDRLKHQLVFKAAMTGKGMSLSRDGACYFYDGPSLSKHAESVKYTTNQVANMKYLKGFEVKIFNKHHLVRVVAKGRQLFRADMGHQVSIEEYDDSHDTQVTIINLRGIDGGTLDGEAEDCVILDACGTRPLTLMQTLLKEEIGFTMHEIVWPESLGGGRGHYFSKIAVNVEETTEQVKAFCQQYGMPFRVHVIG